ncbi:Uncharacterized protein Rs2_43141 [Raphanus sativus]|nr:Uncharacterized protein Rs2_43141 [Raphanus sativus]
MRENLHLKHGVTKLDEHALVDADTHNQEELQPARVHSWVQVPMRGIWPRFRPLLRTMGSHTPLQYSPHTPGQKEPQLKAMCPSHRTQTPLSKENSMIFTPIILRFLNGTELELPWD